MCQMAALCARTAPDRSVQSIFFMTAVFLQTSSCCTKLNALYYSIACMREEQHEGLGLDTWTILLC